MRETSSWSGTQRFQMRSSRTYPVKPELFVLGVSRAPITIFPGENWSPMLVLNIVLLNKESPSKVSLPVTFSCLAHEMWCHTRTEVAKDLQSGVTTPQAAFAPELIVSMMHATDAPVVFKTPPIPKPFFQSFVVTPKMVKF